MINRENSPIKNIVIDDSNNMGGAVSACVYLAAWVLGEVKMTTINEITGTQATNYYEVDVDLDGLITDKDKLDLTKFNVYCLTSNVSFSCGNLLPSLFKADGRVSLIGQASRGGGCVIAQKSTADGLGYSISSSIQIEVVKNGTVYSIDRGVELDYYLRDISKTYDRSWLNSYISNLN